MPRILSYISRIAKQKRAISLLEKKHDRLHKKIQRMADIMEWNTEKTCKELAKNIPKKP